MTDPLPASPLQPADRPSSTVSRALEAAAVESIAVGMVLAREVQRSFARDGSTSSSWFHKPDDSPVTVADLAVQAIVTRALADATSGPLRLIGEEGAHGLADRERAPLRHRLAELVARVHPEITESDTLDLLALARRPRLDAAHAHNGQADGEWHPSTADSWWLIDPIDGTKGFLRGAQYCIALAFIEAGLVRFAVLGCPNLDDDPERPLDELPTRGALFVAHRGGGGTLRLEDAPLRPQGPIRRDDRRTDGDATIRVCESAQPGPRTHARLDALLDHAFAAERRRRTGLRLDSQCKYALVARGQADVYLRLPRMSLPIESAWDHAPGSLIASEGGAWLGDLDGAPLDFSRGAALDRNRGVLACAPPLAAALLDAARATGAATIPNPDAREDGR